MNATKRSAARAGLVVCSVLAVALTGCRTDVVHERTVYLPAPPPPVVEVPPAPAPQPPPPVVVAPPPEPPPVVVIRSENDFYEPLAPYGRWEVVGSYGRCWVPARVEAGWRPYANGYWQRTDAGWYWASDEPWGWATYHYGRWDLHARLGWIWIPQTQWAPAWVAWREGGGYVGWAPLRPSFSLNLRIGTAVREPAFAPRDFVFVEHRRMLEPVRPKTVVVNNTTIINKTVNITNVKVVNNTVINEGPRPEVVERESGRKVHAVPVRDFRRREEATIVARQRNIPTVPHTNVQTPARTDAQPAPTQPVLPRNANVVEKPIEPATQPAQLPRSPFQNREAVRPHPAERRVRPDAKTITREERKGETDAETNIKSASPTVEANPKPEIKPGQTLSPQRATQPVEKPTVTPRNADVVEKPVEPATQPSQQPRSPFQNREVVRPQPAERRVRPDTKITRAEKKGETDAETNIKSASPTVETNRKPEVKPGETLSPRRANQPVEKQTVTPKPAPQPVTTNPVGETVKSSPDRTPPGPAPVQPATARPAREERERETENAGKVKPIPPGIGRRAINESRPETTRIPADKRLLSPKEKSRAAEQAETNKKKKEDKSPKKKGQDQEATIPSTNSSAPQ